MSSSDMNVQPQAQPESGKSSNVVQYVVVATLILLAMILLLGAWFRFKKGRAGPRVQAAMAFEVSGTKHEGGEVEGRTPSSAISAGIVKLLQRDPTECGKDSNGGSAKCGMNVCCGSNGECGTTADFCDPSTCQQGFGTCGAIPKLPQCNTTGSINKRIIGYYQASNMRTRKCQTVAPDQIQTQNLTHLYYSFASVNPTSFKIAPANDNDTEVYRDFTDLKRAGELETWISVGGHDFSDVGPTHTTWSDLCSTQENRTVFIDSLIQFMDKWGFQGADLNWEYPVQTIRGGQPADTANFVSLVREMAQSFNATGTKYGISVPLPPGFRDMRWYDAKAMEPYVDWFSLMAYDLHGLPNMDDESGVTATVQAHADMREIVNDTMPLWFAELDPAKINFGIALYGRGYTLANTSCTDLGCEVSGASQSATCTNATGVMSLAEIEGKIDNEGLKPVFVDDAMIKYIHWDDQWIGYDDKETIALKTKKAEDLCFGGTIYWSLDFLPANSSVWA